MSAAAKFQFDFTTPVQTARFTASERPAQFTTLPASKKHPLPSARIDALEGMDQQSVARFGGLLNLWSSVFVQTVVDQPAPVFWEFTSTGLSLVNATPRGQGVQSAVEMLLRQFQIEGLISAFDQASVTADALVYSATMPQERWSSGTRRRIHAAALDLQEQHDVVVMFELRRERVRAEGY